MRLFRCLARHRSKFHFLRFFLWNLKEVKLVVSSSVGCTMREPFNNPSLAEALSLRASLENLLYILHNKKLSTK